MKFELPVVKLGKRGEKRRRKRKRKRKRRRRRRRRKGTTEAKFDLSVLDLSVFDYIRACIETIEKKCTQI